MHSYTPLIYGAKVQMVLKADNGPFLDKDDNTYLRKIVGELLFYFKAIDGNFLMGLNTILLQQDKAIKNTTEMCTYILNFCASYLDAVLTCNKSNMVLHIHTGALYLCEIDKRNQAGGYFFLIKFTSYPTKAPHNAPIFIL